jgi:REP element-mobilizing transposase RayT
MTERFRNIYRVPSARMRTWDYTTHAAYFITICTAGHTPCFGTVVGSDSSGNLPKTQPVVGGSTNAGAEPVETRCIASLPHAPQETPVGTRCIASPPHAPRETPVETRCIASLPANTGETPVRLSALGEMLQTEWLKTPGLRPDMNLALGKFVVMPDHFHAILIIGANKYNAGESDPGIFGPQRKNLASVIRGFKSAVTMFARKNNITFDWQTRFYDRIIRNDQEYYRIEKYIEENPRKWLEKNEIK